MTKEEFIKKCAYFLEKTGMSEGDYNSYMSIGDRSDINTSLYIDSDGVLWISEQDSVKRIKTSINVDCVTEFRYDRNCYGFFIITSDYSGLYFHEGNIAYFENGDFYDWQDALDWFEEHPVQ